MSSKYKIGTLEFKTKKSCVEYTRNKIKSLGECILEQNTDDYNFFYNLLENHSESIEKIGVGIENFSIEKNKVFNHLTIIINRINGTKIDFSWVHCCNFKPRRTYKENLTNALRSAIRWDILEFKKKQKQICSICKIEDAKEYHVDHNFPPFRDIVSNFLEENSVDRQSRLDSVDMTIEIKFGSDENSYQTILEDKIFEKQWITYHNNVCNLQILCRSCNIKKR